jgi:hypothetical protein
VLEGRRVSGMKQNSAESVLCAPRMLMNHRSPHSHDPIIKSFL